MASLFWKQHVVIYHHGIGKQFVTIRPNPTRGAIFELPFLNHVLQVEILKPDAPIFIETSFYKNMLDKSPDYLNACLIENGLFKSLKTILKDLCVCWELMLMGEPIVVFSTSPEFCSLGVISLVDLIQPIPYGGDYRPYFTIQDNDLNALVSQRILPGLILGVTNPFFLKTLSHWPNILRINHSSNGRSKSPAGFMQALSMMTSLDIQPGITTKHKRFVKRDVDFWRSIDSMVSTGLDFSEPQVNNMIRRHFHELTEKFLAPLNRYFSTLIPQVTLNSHKNDFTIKSFSNDDFLKSLIEHGPQLSFKASYSNDWLELYRKFLKSNNFPLWLQNRQNSTKIQLHRQYWDNLMKGDQLKTMILQNKTNDILNVILYLLSRKNDRACNYSKTNKDEINRQIETIMNRLPESMKASISDFLSTVPK
ncbi:DUF1630-domain-containing protein [Rozella allomycis CSF55]|uniref:DUF1630-domain-containing protein n=1 Tax=Rozella allomycis (strain CSF55) TaxID=988480 RepID=A0A075ATM2_ROZAC|nr:FAM116 domain-containing protein [Rozella allomycis CSF55]RKP18463.1 DUF1630-domain-containing protein [Rozella allomycis CSF55]|eukprot:EPZ33621.1 FAM116 domain-containing protein [Rozella allomycis CSF55]